MLLTYDTILYIVSLCDDVATLDSLQVVFPGPDYATHIFRRRKEVWKRSWAQWLALAESPDVVRGRDPGRQPSICELERLLGEFCESTSTSRLVFGGGARKRGQGKLKRIGTDYIKWLERRAEQLGLCVETKVIRPNSIYGTRVEVRKPAGWTMPWGIPEHRGFAERNRLDEEDEEDGEEWWRYTDRESIDRVMWDDDFSDDDGFSGGDPAFFGAHRSRRFYGY